MNNKRDMTPTDGARKPDLPHGAFTRIARRMRPQVSVQHVREVYFGRRRSPRVERAIRKYLESQSVAA